MYWLAILLAAQVAASPLVVAPQHQNEKRLCILWIFGDCKTTTTSTPVPTSSSISSSYSQPSSSQPASPSATPGSSSQVPSSASPSPTATSEVVPTSLDPSSTVTPIITATPTPTGTPTSSLEPLSIPSGPFFSLPLPQAFSPGSLPPWGGFFSYSQAPVPSNTLSSNPTIFTAAAADAASIAQAPTVRNYEFNLGYSAGSPDGFLRSVMTINNRFPGPLIEANAGDTVVINVRNSLAIPASIHWHGIRQNGTNFMDGVPGISQCPIPPGGSFTYRFTLNGGEMGTYWYHSHYGNTMADGLVGGFIVHSPDDPLKLGQDYDEDRIVYVSDWMDDQSEVISAGISNLFKGYRGLPIVTAPDAVLVNGVGQVDCRKVQRGVPCNQNNGFAEITAPAGKRIRFRIINTGSHAMIRFSIDKHTLQVIEADDTPINAVSLREVPINTGQRYSVIATLDQGAEGSSFWIRANAATFCINPLATVVGKAILRYGSGSGNPTTSEWPDNANPAWGDCIDLDQKVALVPRIVESVGSASSTSVMNSLFGVFVDKVKKTPYIGFGMNGVAYTNYINRPLLSQLEAGLKLNGAELASITITDTGYADIIINVMDPPPLSHPFHLHGRPFYILARGAGYLPSWWPFVSKNTKNPLRRDTITIPHWSWALLRLKLDDPGVWPLHCHIGWHLAVGKLAVVVVRPDVMKGFAQPDEWKGLCAGTDTNEIGPAKRNFQENLNATHWPSLGHPFNGPFEPTWLQHNNVLRMEGQ